MREYGYDKKWEKLLTPHTVSLLTSIHELKGQQFWLINTHAEELTEMLEIAKLQSIESSNRIEGILTSNARMKKLVQDKTVPGSNNEQKIAAYRDVLNTIHKNYAYISVSTGQFQQFHRDLYKVQNPDEGGRYKNTDNVMIAVGEKENKNVIINTVSAKETPAAMESLCRAYNEALQNDEVDPLILTFMFILDFLCISPFNDGNARMSRLLTLLLLCKNGYVVGKYISIEKIIEMSNGTYYEAIKASLRNWNENKNDYAPFVNYMLEVIVAAYKEFSSSVRLLTMAGMTKGNRIGQIIKETTGTITKSEILKKCPGISQITVQRALIDLQNSGKIKKIGGGRYTKYIWNWDREEN